MVSIGPQLPPHLRNNSNSYHSISNPRHVVDSSKGRALSSPAKFSVNPQIRPNVHVPRIQKKLVVSQPPAQTSSSSGSSSFSVTSQFAKKGLVGLANLGNTCFMNSALQCMFQTPILQQFFVQDSYVAQLNRDNALGFKGKIAEAYASLLKRVWRGDSSVISPQAFKQVLGSFAPRFNGYEQQDSSELLSFLLDGLHEDLNQVRKKPQTHAVESDGQDDEGVARESWRRHLLRNRSIIVERLQGQLKSTLVCPVCQRVAVKFDPFMMLSVPLPQPHARRFLYITLYASTGTNRYGLLLLKDDNAGRVKRLVSDLSGYPVADIISCVMNLQTHLPSRIVKDHEHVSVFESEPVRMFYAFRLPGEKPQPLVHIFHKTFNTKVQRWSIAGRPSMVRCSASDTSALVDYVKGLGGGDFELKYCSAEKGLVVGQCFNGHKDCEGCELPATLNPSTRSVLSIHWVSGLPPCAFASCDHSSVAATKIKESSSEVLDLGDCLEMFTREEKLNPSEAWFCNKCKDFRQATKKLDIWQSPDVLVIHLKRLYPNRKVDTPVRFPIEGLDMSRFSKHSPFVCPAAQSTLPVTLSYPALSLRGGSKDDTQLGFSSASSAKSISATSLSTPSKLIDSTSISMNAVVTGTVNSLSLGSLLNGNYDSSDSEPHHRTPSCSLNSISNETPSLSFVSRHHSATRRQYRDRSRSSKQSKKHTRSASSGSSRKKHKKNKSRRQSESRERKKKKSKKRSRSRERHSRSKSGTKKKRHHKHRSRSSHKRSRERRRSSTRSRSKEKKFRIGEDFRHMSQHRSQIRLAGDKSEKPRSKETLQQILSRKNETSTEETTNRSSIENITASMKEKLNDICVQNMQGNIQNLTSPMHESMPPPSLTSAFATAKHTAEAALATARKDAAKEAPATETDTMMTYASTNNATANRLDIPVPSTTKDCYLLSSDSTTDSVSKRELFSVSPSSSSLCLLSQTEVCLTRSPSPPPSRFSTCFQSAASSSSDSSLSNTLNNSDPRVSAPSVTSRVSFSNVALSVASTLKSSSPSPSAKCSTLESVCEIKEGNSNDNAQQVVPCLLNSSNSIDAKHCDLYDLYAVSHHMGSAFGGHYNAVVKSLATGQWYCMDDSSISRQDPLHTSKTAYVLFYRRRNLSP